VTLAGSTFPETPFSTLVLMTERASTWLWDRPLILVESAPLKSEPMQVTPTYNAEEMARPPSKYVQQRFELSLGAPKDNRLMGKSLNVPQAKNY